MNEAERVAAKIAERDPYLINYLKGWWGIGPAQPWGAAMSFCLEVAHGYGLIRSECRTSPTELGEAVRAILEQETCTTN